MNAKLSTEPTQSKLSAELEAIKQILSDYAVAAEQIANAPDFDTPPAIKADDEALAEATQAISELLIEAERKGILTLASRFRGKKNTSLSGREMAIKIMETEANKLLDRLEALKSKELSNG